MAAYILKWKKPQLLSIFLVSSLGSATPAAVQYSATQRINTTYSTYTTVEMNSVRNVIFVYLSPREDCLCAVY